MAPRTFPASVLEMRLKPIPLGYLKMGDRFVATLTQIDNSVTIISGEAHMDGHWVSDNYGFRAANDHYLAPNKEYINVRLDGQTYEDFRHVNDTLYLRSGWMVYVTKEIAERVRLDEAANRNWESNKEARRLEQQKEELQAQVAILQKKIEALGV